MSSLDPEEARKQVEIIQKRLQGIRDASFHLSSQVPMYLESRAGKTMHDIRESIFYACRDINFLLAILGLDESIRFETEDESISIEPVFEKEDTEKKLLLECREFGDKHCKATEEILIKQYGLDTEGMARFSRDIHSGAVVLRIEQKTDELEVRYERSAEKV